MTNEKTSTLNRREFVAKGPLLGPACLAAALEANAELSNPAREAMKPVEASDFIYTTCQQCNTGCETKVRIQDGLAVKIDGNPYGPRAMDPHIDWSTPVTEAARLKGHICPKG